MDVPNEVRNFFSSFEAVDNDIVDFVSDYLQQHTNDSLDLDELRGMVEGFSGKFTCLPDAEKGRLIKGLLGKVSLLYIVPAVHRLMKALLRKCKLTVFSFCSTWAMSEARRRVQIMADRSIVIFRSIHLYLQAAQAHLYLQMTSMPCS
jgi:hypothetical protein